MHRNNLHIPITMMPIKSKRKYKDFFSELDQIVGLKINLEWLNISQGRCEMKRTIILKAMDDETKIKIVCKIDKRFIGFSDPNDKMYQFTESIADKLIDILRVDFYSSSIKRINP